MPEAKRDATTDEHLCELSVICFTARTILSGVQSTDYPRILDSLAFLFERAEQVVIAAEVSCVREASK